MCKLITRNEIKKIVSLAFIGVVSSCSSLNSNKIGEIKTFAFNDLRTGVIEVNLDFQKLKELKLEEIDHFKDASKFLPLYLKFKDKNVIYYANSKNQFNAFDIRNKVLVWSVSLPGIVTGMPVYSSEKKIFYVLTRSENVHTLVSVNQKGEVTSQYSFTIEQILRGNHVDVTNYDINYVNSKTAIALNEINDQHYVYFGFSTPKNPYEKNLNDRTYYGQNLGVSGFLMGVPIENSSGQILQKNPFVFLTSKNNDKKMGVDSGIYLAGGAPALLPDNTIILNTGNGPSFPNEDKFGCSIVRLDGNNFLPLKGKQGFSYISKDLEGFQECHSSNLGEFTSSWSSLIRKEDGSFLGVSMDKGGDVFLFDPENLSGNKEKNRHRLDSRKIFKAKSVPIYSNGNIFYKDKNVNLIVHHNNGMQLMQNNSILESEMNHDYLNELGYEKKECIGLLKKQGHQDNKIFSFYSGEIDNNIVLANERMSQLIEDERIDELKLKDHHFSGYTIQNQKVPMVKNKMIGYSLNKEDNELPGYTKEHIHLFVLHNEFRFLKFSHFNTPSVNKYSEFDLEKNEIFDYLKWSEDNGHLNRKFKLFNFEKNIFTFLKKQNTKDLDCLNPDVNLYNKLNVYQLKKDYSSNDFKVHSLKIENDFSTKLNWTFVGDKFEKIIKNGLITITNDDQSKMVTLFNAVNSFEKKSFIYMINTHTGELINKFEIEGNLHFSTLAIIDEGLLIPTEKNGLKFYRFY